MLLLVLLVCGTAAGRADSRYQELAGLLRASERWAAKVEDSRLERQLDLSEAKLTALHPGGRAARVQALSLLSTSSAMSAAAKAWAEDEEFKLMDRAANISPTLRAARGKSGSSQPKEQGAGKPRASSGKQTASQKSTGSQAQLAAKGSKSRKVQEALHHGEHALSDALHKTTSTLIETAPASQKPAGPSPSNSSAAAKDLEQSMDSTSRSTSLGVIPRQDLSASKFSGGDSKQFMAQGQREQTQKKYDIRFHTAEGGQPRPYEIAIKTPAAISSGVAGRVGRAGPRASTLADWIVAPTPAAASHSHTEPSRVSALEKTDSALREMRTRPAGSILQGTWRQGGSYPLSTIGGIPTEGPDGEEPVPPVCPQPMPTMLHNEMHAMLCWTLQLADGACSEVWTTVPALYQDTVGMALRRRVASAEEMESEPTKVVYDVEEVQQGTTKGTNMGSMAAGSTYQGVAAAWEQHGVSIVHSVPLGMQWVHRWLGLSHGNMEVDVMDCAGQRLSSLSFRMREFARKPKPDQPPVRVASMSTSAGTELAVMRSALGGSQLGSLFELVDEDGRRIGLMVEEGQAGAWLIQLERRPDVDIRVVSMLSATMAIAGQEQLSGFLVGLSVPLAFLLLALAVAFCMRVKLKRTKGKVHTVGAYEDLERDRRTDARVEAPQWPAVAAPQDEPRDRVGIISSYQPSQMYTAPRPHQAQEPARSELPEGRPTLKASSGVSEDTSAAASVTGIHLHETSRHPPPTPLHPQQYWQMGLPAQGGGEAEGYTRSAAASVVSDLVTGELQPRATAEQYRQVPLEFPHAERPRVVSGATALAFRGVDEALAAVEAALAAHPRPGGVVVEDHALQGVTKALDVGAAARAAGAADPFEPFTIAPAVSAQRRFDSEKRFQNALLEHKLDDLATGPLPGLGDRPAVLSEALRRGSAAGAQGRAAAEPQAGAATGWRVEDFRKAQRVRSYSDRTPSLRSELEAGAGRVTPPAAGSHSGSVGGEGGEGGGGYPRSISEWAERNAFAMPEEGRGRGAAAAAPDALDALSHPGLV